MDLGLKGKVALITGGSKGIGQAVALALAQEGANVSICARGSEALETTAEEIRSAAGVEVQATQADVSRMEEIQRLVKTTAERFGRIDILVNNAVDFAIGSLADLPDEAWVSHFNVKVFGYIRSVRAVLPYMQQQAWGRIINIAGIAARQVGMIAMTSGPTNAAIVNFTKAGSTQVAGDNITVNVVHPGGTRTQRHTMNTERKARDMSISLEEAERQTVAGIPIGRLIEPADVANMVVFLASNQASAITGQAIGVDGGGASGVFY